MLAVRIFVKGNCCFAASKPAIVIGYLFVAELIVVVAEPIVFVAEPVVFVAELIVFVAELVVFVAGQ